MSLDISGAYLRGSRQASSDTVYLRLPRGLLELYQFTNDPNFQTTDTHGNDYYWKCDANLYGLQDAGAVWWRHARDWLLGLNSLDGIHVTQSSVDPCIFSVRRDGPFAPAFAVIGLYVDDVLSIFSDSPTRAWFLQQFETEFDQSPDSGTDHREFIGIAYTVSDDNSEIRINCPKLWQRLRTRLTGIELPHTTCPLPTNAMELIYAPTDPTNPIIASADLDVRGILGVANWGVLAVRPAEAHCAALLARRAQTPTHSYCKCLIHYCAYLLAHEADEMVISADATSLDASLIDSLGCWVDSSWGNCPETHRSWFGYAITWHGIVFSFRAKLEPVVALASRDAETIAAVFAVKAVLGFLIMLHELGFKSPTPVPVHVDNSATVLGAYSEKTHKDSRHMSMRIFWLREMVANNLVGLRHIATGDNFSDVFTKILPRSKHDACRAFLMGWAAISTVYAAFSAFA